MGREAVLDGVAGEGVSVGSGEERVAWQAVAFL